eukprot:CAMPEP_0175785078 /NCGR_PEP_ID=MMETSP0097-20121207/79143_1 /TAXON_ID=311494 /ORGANISM="Alexandrium monilatum, Strain CCMP3105" /LENGTH=48 /DNA_ID= /DNA_START= /DNA_END= /DNA_ORIENTATION=
MTAKATACELSHGDLGAEQQTRPEQLRHSLLRRAPMAAGVDGDLQRGA